MRVLIADDQKGVGSTLAAMVSNCDHEVVEVVSSGFDAIQAYHRHRPDLVLMDYYMPHLNGATACRNILSRDPTASVVLVSGVAGAEDLGHLCLTQRAQKSAKGAQSTEAWGDAPGHGTKASISAESASQPRVSY